MFKGIKETWNIKTNELIKRIRKKSGYQEIVIDRINETQKSTISRYWAVKQYHGQLKRGVANSKTE